MDPIPKHIRFAEFLRRLVALPPARSRDDACKLIAETLNSVEEEFSGVPFAPDQWRTDGRMYPVQDDNAADVPGYPGVTSYRSRGHETYVSNNGAIEIQDLEGLVVFQKSGSDGNGVWS